MASSVAADKKIMFEIYRESARSGEYKVVYFTELDEHTKETEIGNAFSGEHVFDGFIRHQQRDQAKRAVAQVVERLNRGETVSTPEIESELRPFLA